MGLGVLKSGDWRYSTPQYEKCQRLECMHTSQVEEQDGMHAPVLRRHEEEVVLPAGGRQWVGAAALVVEGPTRVWVRPHAGAPAMWEEYDRRLRETID